MYLVLDTCNVGIGGEPTGGITLKFSDIQGMPNVEMLVPIGRDAANGLMKGIQQAMGAKTIETATLADLKDMT